MGILVQREFTVARDDRIKFERQSRLGVWENMRYNGAQMIAFGGWGFGGDGSVLVTHSVYADFDHWTATRQWGAFADEQARIEETAAIRRVFAGRGRLIEKSRATIIDYDSEVSSPEVKWRNVGEPLAPVPVSFGRQSVVAETRFAPCDAAQFRAVTLEGMWAWYRALGARPLIYGHDPLATPGNVVTYVAFADISQWHALATPDTQVKAAWAERDTLSPVQTVRLLMVQTNYGVDA